MKEGGLKRRKEGRKEVFGGTVLWYHPRIYFEG
jgi:hypothetical protein